MPAVPTFAAALVSLAQVGDEIGGRSNADWGDVGVAAFLAVCAAGPLAVSVWALLDAARRPAWAWALTERRQAVWMAMILFGTLTVIGGLVISAYYLLKVRPQIAAVEAGEL